MTNKLSLPLGLALLVAGPGQLLAQSTRVPLARTTAKPATTTIMPTVSTEVITARAEALTTNMSQALKLTPAQTEKVRTINLNSVRNVEAARVHYKQEPGKLRSYIEEVGLARLELLKDVLTPAQFARYQQKREEKMGIPTVQGTQGTPPPGLGGGRGGDD